MIEYTIEFPDDFSEFEDILPSKGWFAGAKLIVSDKIYTLTFYDPARLGQAIQDELDTGKPFIERNLLVVNEVTRQEIESAVQWLMSSQQISSVIPD